MIPLWKKKKKKKKKKIPAGYEILIKKRGKFKKVPIRYPGISLPKEEAFALGAKATIGAAAATFKLVPSKKPVARLGIRVMPQVYGLFRPGKKKGEIVQKQRLRIITSGEKKEISYVGIAARKGKPRGMGGIVKRVPGKTPTAIRGGKIKWL